MKRRKRNEQRTVQQKSIHGAVTLCEEKALFFHMATQVTHQNLFDKTTTDGINITCCGQIGESYIKIAADCGQATHCFGVKYN